MAIRNDFTRRRETGARRREGQEKIALLHLTLFGRRFEGKGRRPFLERIWEDLEK